MKRFERILWKLLVIHLILLFVVQMLHQVQAISPILNKSTLYEGVSKLIKTDNDVEK